MKTLSTVLREEGITRKADILEFVQSAELIKASDKKKVISTEARFNYGDSKSCFKFGSQTIYAGDLLVVTGGGNTIEDLSKKLGTLDKKIEAIETEKGQIVAKIEFMRKSGADKFNEKEYRAYGVLQTIKQGGLSD